MKFIRSFIFALFFAPGVAFAADGGFQMAAQLLAAAKNADIQQVQALVNNGADVNFVDSTGLSIVCTALMNNDIRAAQILQMYGADASGCDKQIKNYKSRTQPQDSGGLFGGLSSAQSIALAAAGAAVVVGGVLLLTDVFDPDDDNDKNPSTGNRGEGGEEGGGGGENTPGTKGFTVPYGPAYVVDGKIDKNNYNKIYQDALASWGGTSSIPLHASNFNYFRPNLDNVNSYDDDGISLPIQNYLLMMHGYSPLADGYMGMHIFRNAAMIPQTPVNHTDGGKPISVAVVTNNGVNPVGSAGRGDGILYSPAFAADPLRVDKYLNFESPTNLDGIISLGLEKKGFDLSGAGTAMNPWATVLDNSLAKIVAGWEAGGDVSSSVGDFYGFVPNAQVAVYRTGGGEIFQDSTDTSVKATLSNAESVVAGATVTLGGKEYVISVPSAGAQYTIGDTKYTFAKGGNVLLGKCAGCGTGGADEYIALYKGTDGFYYVNKSGGDNADEVWTLEENEFHLKKTLNSSADVKTFTALYAARGGADVVANLTLNPQSKRIDYVDMDSITSLADAAGQSVYQALVNTYYSNNATNGEGQVVNSLFRGYTANSPIIVMPAGEYAYGVNEGQTTKALTATFENYAPVLYDDTLNHKFITVVAVQHDKNTIQNADTIAAYGNGTAYGKLQLSEWSDDENTWYRSRMCGVAGVGAGNVDPWCFASAGPTAEMATASAAGALAAVKAAFDGTNGFDDNMAFTLLALTADGAYLGTDDRDAKTAAFTEKTLTEYLQNMYTLPPEIQQRVDNGQQSYLNAFKDVFGYGLINLERATTPEKSIYFYNGKNIVGGDKNAYWRAAQNTAFNLTGPFGARGASISAPFYDVLTSVDGAMSMPRIWQNEFSLGADDVHGLYMGDVLAELKTRVEPNQETEFGNMTFSLTRSERAYNDNLDGLDNLKIGYDNDSYRLTADYQHYLTDGVSRFSGMANPVLALASNAISISADYRFGNFAFGGRAFSGAITDEAFLQNDPMISSLYEPLRLGLAQGFQGNFAWRGDVLEFNAGVGALHETETLLGAQTSGLLGLGNGDTTYVDMVARYMPSDWLAFTLRSTFARTVADPTGNFILGLSELDSNAFAFGADIGNLNLTVSQPLAIRRGYLTYAYADYEVVDSGNGHYDLVVADTANRELDLSPDARELRFSGSYRHAFGEFTDGALGFIYRLNPGNTKRFGNESIFMLKMTHRLGI